MARDGQFIAGPGYRAAQYLSGPQYVTGDDRAHPGAAVFEAEICPRIVIELTEHRPIEDYSSVHRALQEIRDNGARLAADDLGSGYAGFRHLVALHPES